ncbi:MAG: type IA DNA topoisomerase [Rhizorhabdus sp.]|uniref:DNA topoisomerase n=1 Tax=Rhizorhabdus sp. TaxID=1968843 RepID=UPI001B504DA9|nr:DNA topoisomerase [Rhizorhabdus sp.]MBP8232233.1 type IA DNA topoisomerase [Rhizorhabdus sp.]
MSRLSASGPTLYLFEKGSVLQASRPVLERLDPGAVLVTASGNLYDTVEPDEIDPGLKDWRAVIDRTIYFADIPVSASGNAMNGKRKSEILAQIAAAARGCKTIVIATDDDREGDKIGWDIVEHKLDWRGPVRRMRPRAVTAEAIERAFRDMMAAGESGAVRSYCGALEARGRQHADYHIGMNGTRQATVRLRPPGETGVWRYGPVLMPTLDILAERELEIRDFKPVDYFKVRLLVSTPAGDILVLLHNPKERIFERAKAEAIAEACRRWRGGPVAVETKETCHAPPALYNLDSMQLAAGRAFGFSPSDTLKTAQELYDKGYISYPRGTGTFLPLDEATDAARVIAATRGHPALGNLAIRDPIVRPTVYRAERKSASGESDGPAHYAVVPTTSRFQPSQVSREASLLYELIARRFVAAHLPDAVDDATTIKLLIDGAEFAARGTVEREAGWRAVERPERAGKVARRSTEADEDGSIALPAVDDGTRVSTGEASTIATKTAPPKRISLAELPTIMARLIDWVEDPALRAALDNGPHEPPKGLGTPATRSRIVDNLFAAKYVEKLKAKGRSQDPALVCTELGLKVRSGWRSLWPDHCEPVRRAQTEQAISAIGRARSMDEASGLLVRWKDHVLGEVEAMVAAFARGRPSAELQGRAVMGLKPTPKMVGFAEELARRAGLTLPENYGQDASVCRKFLDEQAAPRQQAGGRAGPPGAKPATDKQIALVEKLVRERGAEPPPAGWKADAAATSAFIDRHIGTGSRGPVGGSHKAAAEGRSPLSITRRNRRKPR